MLNMYIRTYGWCEDITDTAFPSVDSFKKNVAHL